MRRLLVLLFCLSAPVMAQNGASTVVARPILVGYLPQWGLYSTPPWSAQQLVTSGSARLLDQIDYSQAKIVNGHCAIADPEADVQHVYTAQTSVDGTADTPEGSKPTVLRGEFHQLQELHRLYPHIRMLISIEGNASAFADAATPEKRPAFVASCIDMFLRGNVAPDMQARDLFTGIDVDWEYPNRNGPGGRTDGADYSGLLVEFRRQLTAYAAQTSGAEPYLTVAVSPGLGRYPGVAWPTVARSVDLVGLMNYDYNGPWQKQTGIVAPLYAIPGAAQESGNVDGTVREYESAGIPAAKLLLGVPFYGYQWTGVTQAGTQHGLGAAGKPMSEDTPYHGIVALPGAAKPFRDPHSAAPWIYDGNAFWTYEDPTSIEAKAAYARAHGLAGMMIWELSDDTAEGTLTRAMRAGLNPSRSAPAAEH
jgi:chitinase